jgi:8-amino-7-oxononanoate synthase
VNGDASPLRRRLDGELNALRGRDEFRSLGCPAGLNLCSNDYLGLAADSRLAQAAARAIAETGRAGSGGSRLLAGNSPDWERAEAAFAAFIGAEAALHFSSGYAANLGLLGAILRPGDVVFSDSLNHASLIDGIRLSGARKEIYPHADLTALESALARHEQEPGAKVIVTESLFSMEGDTVPLAALLALARRYGAELVVDEAHALGVRGPAGRGLAAEAGIERELLAAVYPCGKALGSAGAFVCSSARVAEYLVNRARTFIFSTAPPPHLAHQLRAAVDLARGMDAERAHLENLARTLRQGLRAEGFDISTSNSQIVPVVVGTSEAALAFAGSLREDGFAVRAIRPPTVPAGRARVRLSLTARLTFEDIDRLLRACVRARERSNCSMATPSPR